MNRLTRALKEYVDLDCEGNAPDVGVFVRDQPAEIQHELRQAIAEYHAELSPHADALEQLKPGLILGGFQLIRLLGSGGMAVVWEAEQLTIDRKIALKILSPRFSTSPAGIQRFWREARACGRVQHPNVTTIHHVGEADSVHFIALELVGNGKTLADRINELRLQRPRAREEPWYYWWLADAIASIAEALRAVHLRGVIHQDVKPTNILIALGGEVKLADFGLAIVRHGSEVVESLHPVGTEAYMSPEQAGSSALVLDRRTDIFSLGATFFEALTLRRPFEGSTRPEVFAQILNVDPPDPRVLRPSCPGGLAEICKRALQKDRDERYQDADEMARALRTWCAENEVDEEPPERATSRQEPDLHSKIGSP